MQRIYDYIYKYLCPNRIERFAVKKWFNDYGHNMIIQGEHNTKVFRVDDLGSGEIEISLRFNECKKGDSITGPEYAYKKMVRYLIRRKGIKKEQLTEREDGSGWFYTPEAV